MESPVPPFGGTGDFDISSSGLVFVAKDPKLNAAVYTKSDAYYVPVTNFANSTAPKPQIINVPGFTGYTASVVFSHDGKQLAFLRMKTNGYESDKNQPFLIPDIQQLTKITPLLATADGKGRWDRSPDSIAWSLDDKTFIFVASDVGRESVFTLPSDPSKSQSIVPSSILRDGAVSDARPLKNGEIFVSGTSFVDNSRWIILSPGPTASGARLVSSNTRDGALVGLSRSQVSEIWYDGAEVPIQAWVIKPSNFEKGKKYPLAFIIHGGPQGNWADAWSTRWNLAIFAEQGYVVVAPNPTGSTGFGKKLTDDIQEQWGGLPYQDLVKGFEYVKEKLDYVDTDKAVALGASYGGE